MGTLLTVFLIIEMLMIVVFAWSVHYEQVQFLNRKGYFTSQNSMYKEQKEVIFPSNIFTFVRILLMFLFASQNAFFWRIFENTVANKVR